MKASEWRKTLGSSTKAAQDKIFAALIDDDLRLPIDWVGVPCKSGDLQGVVFVSSDALQVGEPGDSVRANVTGDCYQQLCDALGLQLPTPKMLDLVYEARELDVPAYTHNPTNGQISVVDPATGKTTACDMSSVTAMFAQDALITAHLAGRAGLSVSYKTFNLISALGAVCSQGGFEHANYALYDPHAPYLSVSGGHKLWQCLSTWHNGAHTDYSQDDLAVHPVMLIGGQAVLVADVLVDPVRAPLISHQGALPFTRHPKVPQGAFSHDIAPAIDTIRIIGG